MDVPSQVNLIEGHLIDSLNNYAPEHELKKIMSYSLIPAGKYFRPLLVHALSLDLDGAVNLDQKNLASSLEIHHTYTLIHDDLPSMDNDNIRRGRPSSHKKFNEWKAILAGDSLLVLSFELLADVTPKHLPTLLALYAKCTGCSGLILGQMMDLGHENDTFENLLKIHELKTARLIQLSLRGANLLSQNPINDKTCKKLGYFLGINFQLLDDLCELTEAISEHERAINPFFKFSKSMVLKTIKDNNTQIKSLLTENNLQHLGAYIQLYLDKVATKLQDGIANINRDLKLELKEIKELC